MLATALDHAHEEGRRVGPRVQERERAERCHAAPVLLGGLQLRSKGVNGLTALVRAPVGQLPLPARFI